ncbi:MAG: hypothetical protein LBR94_02230, partial [Desulfovibrio sp.]|nr:hypothetical protein [Desulfovibrio sp.]
MLIRYILTLVGLFLSACLLGQGTAAAASQKSPAYLRAGADAYYPWDDSLRIALTADEAACKTKYGDNWRRACAVYLGDGSHASGLRLQPDAPGAWRWRHDNTLLFTPDKPLTPDTRYTAHLEGLSL